MRKLMFSTAAILALSLSAFAGTPETKGEAKPTTEATTQTSTVLHWFQPSGANPTFEASNTIDEQEAISTPCVRQKLGCLRGYRDDQFNTNGDPTSGFKPGQVNMPEETLGQD